MPLQSLREGGRPIFIALLIVMTVSTSIFSHYLTTFAASNYDRYYEWEYKGVKWKWTLSIPTSLYDSYRGVSLSERIEHSLAGYDFFVTTQDVYVQEMAGALHNASSQKGYGSYDEVSFLLAFVQCLPYTSDSTTTGYDEYPRFPIETLVDNGGDCEDTSILFATLAVILNYDAIFVSLPRHVAVGVLGTNLNGYYFTYNEAKYYYCETTGEDYSIGNVPREYDGVSARLYAIDKNGQYVQGRSFFLEPSFLIKVGLGCLALSGLAYALIEYLKKNKVEKKNNPPPPDLL
jgi:hypothetical protein